MHDHNIKHIHIKVYRQIYFFFKLFWKNTSIFNNEKHKHDFQNIKIYLGQPPILFSLHPNELLYMYLSITAQTIIVVLLLEREKIKHPMYYISQVIINTQKRYPVIDKLEFSFKVMTHKLRRYFGSHTASFLTSYLLNNIPDRPKVSGSVTHMSTALEKYYIKFQTWIGIKS